MPIAQVHPQQTEQGQRFADTLLPTQPLCLSTRLRDELDRPRVVAFNARARGHARDDPRGGATRRCVGDQGCRPPGMLRAELAAAEHPEVHGNKHLRLRGLGCVPGGKQRVACLRQPLGIATIQIPHGSGPAEEKLGPFGIVFGPEPKRGVVETFGSLARTATRPGRRIAGVPLPTSPRTAESSPATPAVSLQAVVGEHLGLILDVRAIRSRRPRVDACASARREGSGRRRRRG
jgi:hypothetical protein